MFDVEIIYFYIWAEEGGYSVLHGLEWRVFMKRSSRAYRRIATASVRTWLVRSSSVRGGLFLVINFCIKFDIKRLCFYMLSEYLFRKYCFVFCTDDIVWNVIRKWIVILTICFIKSTNNICVCWYHTHLYIISVMQGETQQYSIVVFLLSLRS